jgi:hypothetical protein
MKSVRHARPGAQQSLNIQPWLARYCSKHTRAGVCGVRLQVGENDNVVARCRAWDGRAMVIQLTVVIPRSNSCWCCRGQVPRTMHHPSQPPAPSPSAASTTRVVLSPLTYLLTVYDPPYCTPRAPQRRTLLGSQGHHDGAQARFGHTVARAEHSAMIAPATSRGGGRAWRRLADNATRQRACGVSLLAAISGAAIAVATADYITNATTNEWAYATAVGAVSEGWDNTTLAGLEAVNATDKWVDFAFAPNVNKL